MLQVKGLLTMPKAIDEAKRFRIAELIGRGLMPSEIAGTIGKLTMYYGG